MFQAEAKMKVIWRPKGSEWQVAEGTRYTNEAHLQALLAANPDLIPFEDISRDILPPSVMIPEVGLLGSGSTDLVGITQDGGISIVECKLAANPEIKRKVLGQVFEYAAFLWRKPYDFLDKAAQLRLGKSLAWAVLERLDNQARQEWDEGEFVESVTQALVAGDFQLVIAVDAVTEDLRRTIEYLNQGPAQMTIYALEVSLFSNQAGEILVPHLHGTTAAIKPPPGGTRWTPERFFPNAEQNHLAKDVVDTLQNLLEFCEAEASRVYWGMGRQTGSFTFHTQHRDRVYSLFSVYSDGRLAVNFGWLKDHAPRELLERYWQELRSIPGFQRLHVRDDFNVWPSIKIVDAFRTPHDLATFKAAVQHFRDGLIAI
jgi:hypothetical protein